MTVKLTIVNTESDWEALYHNDECIFQDHSLSLFEVLNFVSKNQICAFELEIKCADYDWMEKQGGYLPQSLSEVEFSR